MAKWVKTWEVEAWSSSRGEIKSYRVSIGLKGEWGCSCPHWKFRREECKHIREIQLKERWADGDAGAVMRLTALRIGKLRAKGKTDADIEKDLSKDLLN